MERCKTCKHWVQEDPKEYGSLLGGGECLKAPQVWDVTEDADCEGAHWNGCRRLKPESAAVLAVVEDGSSYHARLVTMADFGCVQHEFGNARREIAS
jgi:hypothetical protein